MAENFFKKFQKSVFVIAEIGKNFIQTEEDKSVGEYIKNAKALIKAAKEAGADAVKFQTHNLEDEQMDMKVMSPHFSGTDRYNWVKRNNAVTPARFWKEIKKYANKLGIIFFSAPMSRGAAKILTKVGVDLWKVGSGDILDFVMLDYLAETKKPIIISTGMSTVSELDRTIEFLKKKKVRFSLVHCVSIYPCPPELLNLQTIDFLKHRYNVPVGFSDHSIGHESAVAATNMGAVIIEKHFSHSRDLWGSDHKVSMTPAEFKHMVEQIRTGGKINIKPGKNRKILQKGEKAFRPLFRKSLVYGQNLKSGVKLIPEMVYAMRPGGIIKGLPSEEYENVLGKWLRVAVKKYQPVKMKDFK